MNIDVNLRNIKKFIIIPFANILTNACTPVGAAVVSANIQCTEPGCTNVEDSYQQHKLHLFSAHGIKDPIGRYVSGTHCVICLKDFHTRVRIINHHKHRSKICADKLLTTREIFLSVEEAKELDIAERARNRELAHIGRRSHFAKIPQIQLVGCLPACLMLDSRGRPLYPPEVEAQNGPASA